MLKMKKAIGILLAVCFVLSVTVASVSAAPDPGQWSRGGTKPVQDSPVIKPVQGSPVIKPVQGHGKATPGYDRSKNSPVFGDMNKWNTEKRNWDNQKSKWNSQKKKWDGEKSRWNKDKRHGNDL